MQKAAQISADEYQKQKKRLEKLKKICESGKSIIQDPTYYDDRLINLEKQYKRWKDQYPEYFI